MPDQVIQFSATIASGLLIAIVTAIVTVRLAVGRFRSERWWERKERAYSDLLLVIFGYVDYTSKHILDQIDRKRYTAEEKASWEKDWRSFNERYSKARGLASLHLSAEAVRLLDNYDKEKYAAKDDEDWFNWMENDLEASKKCLSSLIAEAKRICP